MSTIEQDAIRREVRDRYAKVATSSASSCCCGTGIGDNAGGCCSSAPHESSKLGYSADDVSQVPEGANMGLGCGNPQAIASLKQGEIVVDLGSGGGFDCFLAAKQVGDTGHVIGVDMTAEMIGKARSNAVKGGYANVEFRLGEIENLPVADNSADIIMSNCVINLSPDKQRVYNEAYRILKPDGRIAISDVVAIADIPGSLKTDKNALCGCISGASSKSEIERMLQTAGFSDISVELKYESREFIKDWAPGSSAESYVCSAGITARKAS